MRVVHTTVAALLAGALTGSLAFGAAAQDADEDWLDGLVDELEEELAPAPGAGGGDMPDWMDDPFGHLATRMETVEGELRRAETGEPTQAEQQGIVDDMDTLIALIEEQMRQQQQQASRMGSGGNRPAQDSNLRERENDTGELVARARDSVFGTELTAEERERILQAQQDTFPAGYEALVEEYLRRLAAGEPVGDAPVLPGGDAEPAGDG